jgi:hydroxypyruvate isomerase
MSGITPAAAEPERCAATLAANLDHAAATLAEVGAIAQVEALNSRDVPGYHLTSTAAALAAIDAAGHPNLAIQYDLYHMQIMEGDLIRTMAANLSRIGHIQFADNPGRHEPGTGEINFPQVFAAIDAMGYAGYVGAEYTPSMRTEDTLGWRQV